MSSRHHLAASLAFALAFVFASAFTSQVHAQADAPDWPCFLSKEDAARLSQGLENDLGASRQRLIDKVLGDLPASAGSCPAAARSLATFRQDLTSVFDEAISKERVMARLRVRWSKRSGATDCQKSAKRTKETLEDIKSELDAVQREANAELKTKLPAVIERGRTAALSAVESCISEEQARLAREPDSRSSASPSSSPSPSRAEAPAMPAGWPPGLSIDPPATFIVTQGKPGEQALLKIKSATGKPPAANVDGSLCGVGFREAPQYANMTQAQLNQQTGGEEWHGMALATLRLLLDVDAGKPVDLHGIRGMEFIGAPKAGVADARSKNVRMFLTMFDTPKGRTSFSCATTVDALEQALPVFRAIRDTLQPAR